MLDSLIESTLTLAKKKKSERETKSIRVEREQNKRKERGSSKLIRLERGKRKNKQ